MGRETGELRLHPNLVKFPLCKSGMGREGITDRSGVLSSQDAACSVITRTAKAPADRHPYPTASWNQWRHEALGTTGHAKSQTWKAVILTAASTPPSSLGFHESWSSRPSSDGVMRIRVCLLSTYCVPGPGDTERP